MSALSQKRTSDWRRLMSALPPKSGHGRILAECLLCAKSRHLAVQQIYGYFQSGIGFVIPAEVHFQPQSLMDRLDNQPLKKGVFKLTMKLPRRKFLHVAVVAAALQALPRIAVALDYPARTVRVIVPFAPGGPLDVFGRLMAEKLSEHFGEQFYIENIGGGGGNIGTSRAAKAAADGYTLLLTANNHIINPLLYELVPYDAFKDFEPVTLAVGFPTALSVNPSLPARTVSELVALVRATPGKYSFASAGVGTPSHLLGERFRQKLSLDLVHVPYNGSGPATAAVMAGDTPVCFAALTAAAPLAQGGRVRVLATMSKARSRALPGVPTIAEAGYAGLDGEGWDGIFVPAGTSQEIVKLLGNEIRNIIVLPDVAARIEALGFSPVGAPSEMFAKQLTNESATWREVIRAAGLKMQ